MERRIRAIEDGTESWWALVYCFPSVIWVGELKSPMGICATSRWLLSQQVNLQDSRTPGRKFRSVDETVGCLLNTQGTASATTSRPRAHRWIVELKHSFLQPGVDLWKKKELKIPKLDFTAERQYSWCLWFLSRGIAYGARGEKLYENGYNFTDTGIIWWR